MRIATLVLAGTGLAYAITMGVALAGKDEIKPHVKMPKTWEAAVEEAKKYNLPIVVHSHSWT
jgi:hypothetical protein